MMEEILVIAFYVFLSAFWGVAYYQERKRLQERKLTADELASEFFSDVGIQSFGFEGGFSVNQITHLSPNALPGRNYNFSGKTQAVVIVVGGGFVIGGKFTDWRTDWRKMPKVREII